MSELPQEILDESRVLFEDVRPGDVDPEEHAPFVIARVLERGTMRSVAALVHHYGRERLVSFFREGGSSQLSPRTVPLWAAYLKLTKEECTRRSSPRSKSPFWPD